MRYFPHFQRCLKPGQKGFEAFSLLGKMELLQQADHVPCQNSGRGTLHAFTFLDESNSAMWQVHLHRKGPRTMMKHISAFFSCRRSARFRISPVLFTLLILTPLLLSSCDASPAVNQARTPTPHRNTHSTLLDSVHMFNEQQGWALSENDQTWPAVYGIVRTTDGGQTWQDMTPPGYTLHGPMAGFVSPTMAWVVMPQADNSTTQIIHTTDGGQTWQGSTIGANAITHVTFLDGQHGWLLASTDNDQHFDLWRTTDGTTWQDIAHVTPFQAWS
jgi:hypothetical protein